jgi:hypothetical protein
MVTAGAQQQLSAVRAQHVGLPRVERDAKRVFRP